MARIRSIKPEFWTSEQITECSTSARLLFIGLWTFCDDGGRMPFSVKRIKAQIFPADDMSSESVRRMIDELSSSAVGEPLVKLYEVDGKQFLQITGWEKHQRIDRPTYQFPDEKGVVPQNNGHYGSSTRRALDRGVDLKRVDKNKKERGDSKTNPLRARKRARGSVEEPTSNATDATLNATDDWPSNYREQFAEVYPSNVSMAAALEILDDARRKVSWHELLVGLANYAENKPADRHWMNPKTWLEQERWNDKPARTSAKHERRHVADELAEEARRLEGEGNSQDVAVGGAELGGDHAQVVPGRKPA